MASDLRRVAEATHAWGALADAYREALDLAEAFPPSLPWAARLRLALGEILDARLDDPRGALACYTRVLTHDPAAPTAAKAAIRAAARVARWDAIAKTLVEASSATGAVDAGLVVAVEEALGGASAWEGLASALTLAIAERSGIPHPVARELEARLAEWHRDRRGDPEAAEEAFVRALAHAPDDAQLLAALAQLQRRTKGRPLVDSLLRLSAATGGDLDLLREAADVARTSVSDRVLAKSIVERVLRSRSRRGLPTGEDAVTVSSGVGGRARRRT